MSLFAFFFAVAKVGRANPFKVRSESILMSALFDLELVKPEHAKRL